MLLAELAREHVFHWLSSVAIQSEWLVYASLHAGLWHRMLVTILMSNDATAVILTPVILLAVCKAKVQPLPHLFACALVANPASFVLPISNPANLVVFHGVVCCRSTDGRCLRGRVPALDRGDLRCDEFLFHRDLRAHLECKAKMKSLNAEGKLVLVGNKA